MRWLILRSIRLYSISNINDQIRIVLGKKLASVLRNAGMTQLEVMHKV